MLKRMTMQVRDFAAVWEGEYVIELRDDSNSESCSRILVTPVLR